MLVINNFGNMGEGEREGRRGAGERGGWEREDKCKS